LDAGRMLAGCAEDACLLNFGCIKAKVMSGQNWQRGWAAPASRRVVVMFGDYDMKKRFFVLLSLVCLVALLLAGCGGSSGEKSVSGSIAAREPAPLPANAVVRVQIHDVNLADGKPSKVIGQQIILQPKSWPIAFEVKCPSADVVSTHSYTLLVTITDAQGDLVLMNQEVYFVLTRLHHSSKLKILVDRVE